MPPNDDEVTQWRLARVEADLKEHDGIPERMTAVENGLTEVKDSMSKLIWAVVGFALTVAASACALVIASGGGP